MTDYSRFEVKCEDLDWVPNSEKTRWFLVLRLRKPEGDGLNRLLDVCNGTVEEYSQPSLYAASRHARERPLKVTAWPRKQGRNNIVPTPKTEEVSDYSSAFHISVAWTLEQPSSFVMNSTKSAINDEAFEALESVPITVDAVKVKVGNIVTSIFLPLKVIEGKSLFGI
jgi:U6 snRNA phosphodiesterase